MAATRADLIEGLAAHVGTSALTASEIESILALAAVAAHGTGDRTAAPLASFIAGVAAAGSEERQEILDGILRRATELAPVPEKE